MVLGGNRKLWRKIKKKIMINLLVPWEWHDTCHENLNYKLFLFPLFNTDYQTTVNAGSKTGRSNEKK